MEQKTVQYKRTINGSVGAGVSALAGAKGRRYYILEHKEDSKFHKAGESQKIIIDQVELGRAPSCQVRFDEIQYPTVSRRHAAIEKDGEGWKLIHLSTVNSTFVNGRKIETEWHLQNGDEIQLSMNGPRLGFIVPAGKQSLVSSIRMTERLELFRKQALRPYKNAIAAICTLLVMVSCLGGYAIWTQNQEIVGLLAESKHQTEVMDKLTKDIAAQDSINELLKTENEEIKKRNDALQGELSKTANLSKYVEAAKPYVYAVLTTVKLEFPNGESEQMTSQGTGFLLNDGRFVTARHCVQPWLYDTGSLLEAYAISRIYKDVNFLVSIKAVNMEGDVKTFIPQNFTVDSSRDVNFNFTIDLGDGNNVTAAGTSAIPVTLGDGTVLGDETMMGSDWAYAKVNGSKGLASAPSLSSNLKASTTVHLLGFPASLGIGDGKKMIEPIYNKMNVARDGLNNARCIMVSEGAAHGNSGGPVLVVQGNQLAVIGIVSRKESATQQQSLFGITQQQQQYDHLVPISNLQR